MKEEERRQEREGGGVGGWGVGREEKGEGKREGRGGEKERASDRDSRKRRKEGRIRGEEKNEDPGRREGGPQGCWSPRLSVPALDRGQAAGYLYSTVHALTSAGSSHPYLPIFMGQLA